MSYLVLDGFPKGLDVRRFPLAPQPGSLVELSNGHLTNGGEIEKRKAFSLYANVAIAETGAELTAGVRTFGMQETGVGLTVFGSADVYLTGGTHDLADVMPTGVTYQQLKHPAVLDGVTYDKTKHAMTAVTGSCVYAGLIFAVATFEDDNVFCYYDGALVRDMTNGLIMAHLDTNTKIATAIKEMVNRSTRFTATSSTNIVTITGPVGETFQFGTNKASTSGVLTPLLTSLPTSDVVANAATGSFKIMAGSSSAGVNKITKVEVNGVTITNAAVDWTTSNEVTAGLIAASINTKVSSPEYTASANGNTVTIFAAESQGSTPNGFEVNITAAGNVCCGDAAFQFIGSAFTVDSFNINGTNILSATIPYPTTYTTLNAATAAMETNINAGTSAGATHGYVARAVGPILFVSKAVTSSDNVALDVFVVLSGTSTTNGGGVTQINGGLASVPSLTAPASGGALRAINLYKQYSGALLVTATGGVAPYTYEWVLVNTPGNSSQISFFNSGDATSSTPTIFANSYSTIGTVIGTAYCNVRDALGSVKKTQSLQLVLSSGSK